MMNYWDEWELRNSSTGDKKIDKKNRKTYWTNSCNNTTAGNIDASNNGDDVYVCGWSVEGRARFNDILVYIVNVRKKRQQKEFEQRLLMEYLDEDKSSSRKRKRSDGEVDDELFSQIEMRRRELSKDIKIVGLYDPQEKKFVCY